jgi:hypothetical protein
MCLSVHLGDSYLGHFVGVVPCPASCLTAGYPCSAAFAATSFIRSDVPWWRVLFVAPVLAFPTLIGTMLLVVVLSIPMDAMGVESGGAIDAMFALLTPVAVGYLGAKWVVSRNTASDPLRRPGQRSLARDELPQPQRRQLPSPPPPRCPQLPTPPGLEPLTPGLSPLSSVNPQPTPATSPPPPTDAPTQQFSALPPTSSPRPTSRKPRAVAPKRKPARPRQPKVAAPPYPPPQSEGTNANFFDIPNTLETVRLNSISGMIQLSGEEHFQVDDPAVDADPED